MNQGIRQQPFLRKRQTQSLTYLVEPTERQERKCCSDCGAALKPGVRFCNDCGAQVQSPGSFAVWLKARPSLPRRLQAELIDRLVAFALAFVVAIPLALVSLRYFFWLAAGVLLAWHLLRDCSPQRRSFGKWRRGLRVVTAGGRQQCAWWQALLRRLPVAVSQLAYVLGTAALFARFTGWERLAQTIAAPWPALAASSHFIPLLLLLPLIYDVASAAAMLMSSAARRLEDYLLGTQVILEDAYTRDLRACDKCAQLMPKEMAFCQWCGGANELEIES
jgi:uncharacterized RDD family membrane protein YckC